jgi:toxin YoeB
VRVLFTPDGWSDYRHWAETDPEILKRVNALIEDCRRNLVRGLGKPEPLKGDLSGWWSRRITGDHRLVYRIEGAGAEQRVVIVACRFHY